MIMAAEAINLYMNLVIVLGKKVHHFVLKAMISSWGKYSNVIIDYNISCDLSFL